MNIYVFASYSASLLLLFLCIMFLRIGVQNTQSIPTFRILIRLFGILPGFAGVLFGIYLQFKIEGREAFSVMTAWLLLEIGSVQLLNILKKYEEVLPGKSDPVN